MKNQFKNHNITVLGTFFALVLILLFDHLTWKYFIGQEAKRNGTEIIQGVFQTVQKIDTLTTQELDPDTVDLTGLKKLEKKIRDLTGIENLFVGFYNHCAKPDAQNCYLDTGPFQESAMGYNPESRPWYLVSRSHHDWVMLNFIRYRATLQSGYPAAWGWSLTKHINNSWFNLYIPESIDTAKDGFNKMEDPILKMAQIKDVHEFAYFQIVFRTLRFNQNFLSQNHLPKIECHQNNEYIPFSLTYRAVVPCRIGDEFIFLDFSRHYHDTWHLAVLMVVSLLLFYMAYRFFRYINFLQYQNTKNKLEIEKTKIAQVTGTKLIHDLKKGIMAQLNQLPHIYEKDFDSEIRQPDFIPNLKSNFNHHFEHLNLLNKYILLLTNNLKRQKEKNWVILNIKQFQKYRKWLTNKETILIKTSQDKDLLFELQISEESDEQSQLIVSDHLTSIYIPEMAFFRIIKNLLENYHTYGCGVFHLQLFRVNQNLKLISYNDLTEKTENTQSSTHLGLTIIRQLLEDNFGTKNITSAVKKTETSYQITLMFPLIEELQ